MYQNAMLNKGLDNSECVMMRIAKKLGKDQAHELLYEKAMKTELDGKDYFTVLKEDKILHSVKFVLGEILLLECLQFCDVLVWIFILPDMTP